MNLQILHFLVKNSKCEHLGHKGCCFYTLTCYGYVYEGYASYSFCFDNNEKYPSLILDLNHLKLRVMVYCIISGHRVYQNVFLNWLWQYLSFLSIFFNRFSIECLFNREVLGHPTLLYIVFIIVDVLKIAVISVWSLLTSIDGFLRISNDRKYALS